MRAPAVRGWILVTRGPNPTRVVDHQAIDGSHVTRAAEQLLGRHDIDPETCERGQGGLRGAYYATGEEGLCASFWTDMPEALAQFRRETERREELLNG